MDNCKKARKRASKYFKYHNLELPVDIESLLKNKAIVNEEFLPTSGDAICINGQDKPIIFIKSNMSEYRKCFTYAHELGHLEIPEHIGMISCITDIKDEDINMNAYYMMENEANEFAAELLMPTDWLIQLIKQDTTNLNHLLYYIQQNAKVSFMAAVYHIIPLFKPNNLFIIYNKISNYVHVKVGSLSSPPLFLYYVDSSYDTEWLNLNSIHHEIVYNDTMDVHFFVMKRILEPTEVLKLSEYFSDQKNCSFILKKILNNNEISYAHLLKDLKSYLPIGFILKIKNLVTNTYTYVKSQNTYISKYEKSTELQIDNWLSDNCTFCTSFNNSLIEFVLWYFDTNFSFDSKPNDPRDSKTILRDIINCSITDKVERMKLNGKINGVIGSLNNNRDSLDKEQFYNILRQKFYGRSDIDFIVNHPDFNLFLSKKTIELY